MAAALPLQAVMHVEAAVAGNVTGEHIGECDIDDASGRAGIAQVEREQATCGKHGAGLMLDDARRQREWRAPRRTECPCGGAQGLCIKTGTSAARERAVQAEDGGDADNQLYMARRQRCRRRTMRGERSRGVAQQDVACAKQQVERCCR